MKAIVIYNRPMAWFTPFTRHSLFEPAISYDNMVSETVNESPTGYSVEYIMPEFRKKNLSIRVENGVLIVEAKSKSGNSGWFGRNKNFYENHYLRETSLTDDMDTEKISAKFRNGTLTVDIPKKEEYVNYREIPVNGLKEISEAKENKDPSYQNLFKRFKLKIERIFKRAA